MLSLDVHTLEKRRKKILLVDSEPKIRELIILILQGCAYEWVEGNSFGDFWELINDEKPDLVIIDPSKNGDQYDFNLFKHFMRRRVTKFLLLGPRECKREFEEVKVEGFVSYCLKPFSAKELSLEFHNLLNWELDDDAR